MKPFRQRISPVLVLAMLFVGATTGIVAAQDRDSDQAGHARAHYNTRGWNTPSFIEHPDELLDPDRFSISDKAVIGTSSLRRLGGSEVSKTLLDNGTLRGLGYQWDGAAWTLRSESVTAFESGRSVKSWYESFSPSPSTSLNTRAYDDSGRISVALNHTIAQKTLYTYDSSGNLSTILMETFSGSPLGRVVYSYDSSGVRIEYLSQIFGTTDWVDDDRLTYVADSNGFAVSATGESRMNGVWVYTYRNLYTRDSLGRITERLYQPWQNDSWTDLVKEVQTYWQGELLAQQTRYYWSGSNWVEDSRLSTTYDDDWDILEDRFDVWTGSSWMNIRKTEYSKQVGPSVAVVHVPPGANFPPGVPMEIRWISAGIAAVDLFFSNDSGSTWSQIGSSVPDTGAFVYLWTTPDAEYAACKLRVTSAGNPGVSSENDGVFSIQNKFDYVTHTTHSVELSVFGNGYLGDDGSLLGKGFKFNEKPSALWSGGVLYGDAISGVTGMIRSFSIEALQNKESLAKLSESSPFDQTSTSVLEEKPGSYPAYGIEIMQRSFSRVEDDYVTIVYTVRNTGSVARNGFYVGCFLDWDIGSPYANLGGYDTSRGLAYQFDGSGIPSDSSYYGVVALDGMSGARVTTLGAAATEYTTWVSTFAGEPITSLADYRTFIGSGPFDIPPGGSVTVGFALCAGADLPALQTSADDAIALWKSGTITSVAPSTAIPVSIHLGQNYPNPFNPTTELTYSLPHTMDVSLVVFDALGRKVAALVDEEQHAGLHAVTWNAGGMACGMYFYRLEARGADGERWMQTRKMVLLK